MCNRSYTLIRSILLIILALPLVAEGKSPVIRIDMNNYRIGDFDKEIKQISCLKLKKSHYDTTRQLVFYKDRIYVMGYTIAGASVLIYDLVGNFIKEIRLPDAIAVNSMTAIPQLNELWITSYCKFIKKYQPDGKLIKKISLPFPCTGLYPTGNHEYLVYSGGAGKAIERHAFALTDFKAIRELFIPMHFQRDVSHNFIGTYVADPSSGNLLLFPDNIDTVYTFDKQKKELFPLFHLDFHGDFMKLKDAPNSDREMSEIITQKRYIYSHNSLSVASGKLFFRTLGKHSHLYSIRMTDRQVAVFNDLFDNYPLEYTPFFHSDGKKLYAVIQEKKIVEHYKKHKCTYPALQKILPSLSANGQEHYLITIELK